MVCKDLWDEYCSGKQTYEQLAGKYGCSARTIQRKIDCVEIHKNRTFNSVANVILDTTYFGRLFGVMVFKDSLSSRYLLVRYVKYETNELYLQGIEEISRRGIHIQAIICDGRKGLLTLFEGIPVQMCQFHQVQIVMRYLTKKPKLEAAKELRLVCLKLTKSNQAEFVKLLDNWYLNWKECLNQRGISSVSGKSFYTHKRLRSAYLSLKRNLPWLFTFEQYPELHDNI